MFLRSKDMPPRRPRSSVRLAKGPLSQLNTPTSAAPDRLTPLIQGADASLGRNRDVLSASLRRTRMAKGGATAEAVRSIKNAIEHIRNRDPASAESELRRAPDPRVRGVAGDMRNPRKIQSAIKILEDIIAADTDETVEATMAKGGKIKKAVKSLQRFNTEFVRSVDEHGGDFDSTADTEFSPREVRDNIKSILSEIGMEKRAREVRLISNPEFIEFDSNNPSHAGAYFGVQLEMPSDLAELLAKYHGTDGAGTLAEVQPKAKGGQVQKGIEPVVRALKEAIFGPSDEPDWAGAAQIAGQIPGGPDIIAKLGTMKQAFDDPELDEETIRQMVLDLEATIDQSTGTQVPNPNLED